MRLGAKMAMILAAGAVFASMPFQEAIAQSDEAEATSRIAEEIRRLGDQVEEANRHSESQLMTSSNTGLIVALVAILGTVINAIYSRRHFSLLEKDAKERLRPMLDWAVFEENITEKRRAVLGGERISIKIVNAGHVSAIRVTSVIKQGMERDFESGNTNNKNRDLGALPPNQFIVIPVWVSGKQQTEAQEGKEKFCVEIFLRYYAVGSNKLTGREFTDKIVGMYDGKEFTLRNIEDAEKY